MVKSGLEDRPSVSHIRLTLHLSGALVLLATCLWQAFKHLIPHERKAHSTPLALPSILFFAALYIQIAAGGLLAGLKAGYISDTFPLMFGQLVPNGLFNLTPTWINLLDSSPMVHSSIGGSLLLSWGWRFGFIFEGEQRMCLLCFA